MITLERLVGEVKKLAAQDKKRLLEILQNEVGDAQLRPGQGSDSPPDNAEQGSIEPELGWLVANGWVLQKYRGQYLALNGNELLAHGDLSEVLTESRRRGIQHPFIQYIPNSEAEWLRGQGNHPA